MDISIIMPVYNMAEHIPNAIETFEKQTIREKELICIDDCSTDGSYENLMQYAQSNSQIVVVRMERNSGAGPARNKGMSLAKGEYIAFLDADDILLDNDALEKMIAFSRKEKSDLCGGLVQRLYKNEFVLYPRFRELFDCETECSIVSINDVRDEYFYQGYIFKRDFLKSEGIIFPELRRYQDPPFLVEALCKAKRICAVNTELYLHKDNALINFSVSVLEDILAGLMTNLKLAEEFDVSWLMDHVYKEINNGYFEYCVRLVRERSSKGISQLFALYLEGIKLGKKVLPIEYFLEMEKNSKNTEAYVIAKKIGFWFGNTEELLLYGAGNVGTKVFEAVCMFEPSKIVGWIDKNLAGTYINETLIQGLDEINIHKRILIAIEDDRVVSEVCRELEELGVERALVYKWSDIKKTEIG